MNWSKAPEWAKYHAIDWNGEGWWFEEEPYHDGQVWGTCGQFGYNGLLNPVNWEQSLTKRPKNMKYIYQDQHGSRSSDIEPRAFPVSNDDWEMVKAIVWAATQNGEFNKVPAIKAVRLLMSQQTQGEYSLLKAKQLTEAAYNEQ